MRREFGLTDFEDIIKKLKPLPWRFFAIAVAISFVIASLTSSLLGWLISTKSDALKFKSVATAGRTSPQNEVAVVRPYLPDAEIDKILKRNIFNSEGAVGEDTDNNVATEDYPKSDMPIKLIGIIYGGDPYSGMVTYENTAKQNKVDSVSVGQKIEPGALLLEIQRRRIIIERNGQKEYVELIDPVIRRSSRTASRSATTTPTTTNGITPVATKPPPPAYKEPGFDREGDKIKMSGDYKDRLLTQDFQKVLQDAKAEPHMVDGSLRGFRLTKIREASIYDKAGLQNDDIIEEINGVPLNDTAGAIRLLQQLRNEKEIEIRVRRGGSPVSVTLSVM